MFTVAPGRRALVTGGASGFGYAVAERLIACGARVAIADNDQATLDRAAESLGAAALPTLMDVTSATSVRAGVERAVQAMDGLDTLVNSAGVFEMKPFAEITEAEWDWVLDVNLKGTFLACHAALPHLTATGRGRIVNISSDAGKKGWPLIAHYSASKFGVIGLTQSLAVEYGPRGVTVNAVCPSGAPETGMGRKVLSQKVALWGRRPDEIVQSTEASIPLRRHATSADVADAVLFLISEHAGYISGEALNVDGGQLSG